MLASGKIVWDERAGSTGVILEETERRFGTVPRVKDFVKSELRQATEDRERFIKFGRDLEEASANGRVVSQYEWSDGWERETGFLVLNPGKIVKREPRLTGHLSEQQET